MALTRRRAMCSSTQIEIEHGVLFSEKYQWKCLAFILFTWINTRFLFLFINSTRSDWIWHLLHIALGLWNITWYLPYMLSLFLFDMAIDLLIKNNYTYSYFIYLVYCELCSTHIYYVYFTHNIHYPACLLIENVNSKQFSSWQIKESPIPISMLFKV